ncbi:MAG: large subunit ribosomal protein [Candidatus Sumerlaeota bacterium]|nr:large subunit ribosomal protein [Candidatus Sumerlaeota bacterium]
MPKMKTKSGLSKRVKLTASGRVKHKKQGLRHILTKKSSKRKRHLRSLVLVNSSDEKRIKEILHI